MTDHITVDVIGDGSTSNPRRPDYDGPFDDATYHDDGTVTIRVES